MFRMYASNSHSDTHLTLALLESLPYGSLLLHNILAYMTLACLLYCIQNVFLLGPARVFANAGTVNQGYTDLTGNPGDVVQLTPTNTALL